MAQVQHPMQVGDFVVNWFDLAVVAAIGIGIFRGRSRGMSEEMLDLFKWLAIVVLAGLGYKSVARYLLELIPLNPVAADIFAYLAILALLQFVFGWIKRGLGDKPVGSDTFGNWEYYLGMIAGAVRFACYLLVCLALLNTAYLTPEQLSAQAKAQRRNFEDISFPTFGTLQHTIFTGSASGKFVKRYLGHELIVASTSAKKPSQANTVGQREERMINDVLGNQ